MSGLSDDPLPDVPPPPPLALEYRGASTDLPKPAGFAVASLTVGIFSLVACTPCLSLPLAVVALALGSYARYLSRRGVATGAGMALAGMFCALVPIAIWAWVILVVAVESISRQFR